MQNVCFDFSTMHEHGRAFYDFLKLRKALFVDTLGWEIPHNGTVEMDQYDTPEAHYSLVLEDGEVVGGARAMPVEVHWGSHGCMLSDAMAGHLEGIPPWIVAPDQDISGAWECTRLVISDRLAGFESRTECLRLIVDGLIAMAGAQGATDLVSLSPMPLQRALRQLGHDVSRIGQPYKCPSDGRTYATLSMPTRVARSTDLAGHASRPPGSSVAAPARR